MDEYIENNNHMSGRLMRAALDVSNWKRISITPLIYQNEMPMDYDASKISRWMSVEVIRVSGRDFRFLLHGLLNGDIMLVSVLMELDENITIHKKGSHRDTNNEIKHMINLPSMPFNKAIEEYNRIQSL